MKVNVYGLKFVKNTRYAPEIVKDTRSKMKKFIYSIGKYVRSSAKQHY